MATPRATTYNRKMVYGGPQRWASESCSESDFEDEGARTQGYADGATPEVWATPKEEGFGSSGFFSKGDGERFRGCE